MAEPTTQSGGEAAPAPPKPQQAPEQAPMPPLPPMFQSAPDAVPDDAPKVEDAIAAAKKSTEKESYPVRSNAFPGIDLESGQPDPTPEQGAKIADQQD